MSVREALKILMLSPVYFRLDLKDRKDLLNDFLERHGKDAISMEDSPVCSSPFEFADN